MQIADISTPEEVIDTESPVMGNLVLLLAATAVVLCVCFCCLVLCVVRKQSAAKKRWRTTRKISAQAVMSSIVGHKKVEPKAKDHGHRDFNHGTAGGRHSDSDSEDSSDTEHDIEVSMEIGMLDHNGKKRPSIQPHAPEYGAAIHYFDHHEECPHGIAMPSTRAAEPSDDELSELQQCEEEEEEAEVDPTDSGERLSQELWREDREGDMLIAPGEDDVVIGSPTIGPENGDDAGRLLLPPTRGGDGNYNPSDDDEEVPPPPVPFPLRKTPNGNASSDEEEVPPAPGPPKY